MHVVIMDGVLYSDELMRVMGMLMSARRSLLLHSASSRDSALDETKATMCRCQKSAAIGL